MRALPVSLMVFMGLATMNVPSAAPQMITYSHGCQMTRHVAAHGHEAAQHAAERDDETENDCHVRLRGLSPILATSNRTSLA